MKVYGQSFNISWISSYLFFFFLDIETIHLMWVLFEN